MLKTRHSRYRPHRRGMILMVVLALLTLFALVGITFVFVANSQETAARIAREGETQFKPGIDPEAAMALVLGQLLYDVNDDSAGVLSALRGHSLARNMYGWYAGNNPASPPSPFPLNDKPYSGSGRQHVAPPNSSTWPNFWTGPVRGGTTNPPLMVGSEAALINYQYHAGNPTDTNVNTNLNDGFLRDPDRITFRANTTANLGDYVSCAVPYTYPDHQNMFLAQFDHYTGQVVTPSFHREYLFGSLDSSNANWTSHQGKYLTLRPTRAYHPNFPYPVDRGGDVKNLDGAPGGCDSIWIDIGAPVMTAPDGRKYKMLVAPLIIDLDSRMNINVVGNWIGQKPPPMTGTDPLIKEHRGNQGWGPWEVNPAKVLNQPPPNVATDQWEWINLFNGSDNPVTGMMPPPPPAGYARVRGRYDLGQTRGVNGTPLSGGTAPRGWSQVDYNGMTEATLGQSTPYTLPSTFGMAPLNHYYSFPTFPAACFGNGAGENTNHPGIWKAIGPTGGNRAFPLHMMASLLRDGGTNSDLLNKDLRRLLPTNLLDAKRRNLITTLSMDLDRPGAVPYVYDSMASDNPAGEPAAATATRLRIIPDADGIPTLAGNQQIPFPQNGSRGSTPVASLSEFEQTTWRSNLARLLRLRINRPLPEYFVIPMGGGPAVDNSVPATQARQSMAEDVFNILRRVTGAFPFTNSTGNPNFSDVMPQPPNTLPTSSEEFKAIRYLAQLAVNIVDYIDSDDVSTPFQFATTQAGTAMMPTNVNHFVYGYELPRLVLNETYVQYDNEPGSVTGGVVDPTRNYDVNVWVELLNPLPDDGVTLKNGQKDTTALLQKNVGMMNTPEAIYRIRVIDLDTYNTYIQAEPGNTKVDPDYNLPAMTRSRVLTEVVNYGADATRHDVLPLPATNRFNDPATIKTGFYVVAPNAPFYEPQDDPGLPFTIQATTIPEDPMDITTIRKGMNYKIPANAPNADTKEPRPVILLQRLLNPNLPHDPNETVVMGMNTVRNWNYNPYVTVDLVRVGGKDMDQTANDNSEVEDGRRFITAAGGNPNVIAMESRKTHGRSQPFAGTPTERRGQAPMPIVMMKPQHTFFQQNSTATTQAALDAATIDATLKLPFDWLVHLDRQISSPMELLNVSAHKPHDVLRYFVVNDSTQMNTPRAYRHVAPWYDGSARLHRFLEFCSTTTEPRTYWGPSNGRIPGKVNINTMSKTNLAANDPNLWEAIGDPQGGNIFSTADLDTIMANGSNTNGFLDQRTPVYNDTADTLLNGRRVAGPTDEQILNWANNPNGLPMPPPPKWGLNRPFMGFGVGPYVPPTMGTPDTMFRGTRGVANSFLRTVGNDQQFDVPNPTMPMGVPALHPYQRKELLTKIYNSVSGRSNVFAVWLTVGFFEIDKDPNTGNYRDNWTPPPLAAEIGKAENRHVRYRMFAIVDRTQMQVFPTLDPNNNTVPSLRSQNAITKPMNHPSDANGNPAMTWDASITLIGSTNNVTTAFTDAAWRSNRTWTLQDGAVLVYDPGTDKEETVVARPDPNNAGQFIASFMREHNANCTVISRGNPGPWVRYDPRKDEDVVPYFQLID